MLAGCSINRTLAPDTYTVRRGDTLSSIAASHGLDWHDLARWNRIEKPYVIEVGERLSLEPYPRLHDSRAADRAQPQSRSRNTPRVVRAPQDSRAEQRAAIQASTPQLTRTIEHDRAAAGETGAGQQPRQPPAPAEAGRRDDETAERAARAKIDQASRESKRPPPRAVGPAVDGWQWPASGSVVRDYGDDRIRRGIDIGGRNGSPVYAASGGRVVYNGSGLKGYGKLIIIKHDAHYLTAYGFTQRSRVSEGETVALGAHIADMGLGPQNKPMLHFEIRRDGDPINPASVLPDH